MDPQRRRLTVSGTDPTIKAAGQAGGKAPLASVLKDHELKVTCIHTVTDSDLKKKRSFAEKDRIACKDGELVEGKDIDELLSSVFFKCKKGLKPESPNQDSYVIVQCPDKWGLYGVFDGHGPFGHDISEFAVKDLVLRFLESDFSDSEKAKDALSSAFVDCQKAIEAAKSSGLDAQSSGSTCTVAFHDFATDELVIAHVGDSRGVLYKDLQVNGGKTTVLNETEDHKPNLPAEKKRIESMGGRVVFDGYYNYRVFAKAGMYPGLNMSRALGDVVAHKEAGLTAEPETCIIKLKDQRSADGKLSLFLCSDGVWEFIESSSAPNWMCAKPGEDKEFVVNASGAENLAKKSWDSWMEDSENEISDDITVMAVSL